VRWGGGLQVEFRVLILGIDRSGKTTLLEKIKSLYTEYEGLPPDKIQPTGARPR
jgi:ADP-ribosylation factor related protein 1